MRPQEVGYDEGTMNTIRGILVGCSLLLAAACSKKAEPAAPVAPKPEAPKVDAPIPAAPAALAADLVAKLGKADAADGKTDKNIAKCPGCELKMDGDAAHSTKLGDYTLHFCTHCIEKGKDKDAEKIVGALKL